MHRQLIAIVVAAVAVGCEGSSTPSTGYQSEREARLVSAARDAALAEGRSLSDAIYSVRPDWNGWAVRVDRSPGYTGAGEPRITCCASFFVMLTPDGRAREILGPGLRRTTLAAQPPSGASPAHAGGRTRG